MAKSRSTETSIFHVLLATGPRASKSSPSLSLADAVAGGLPTGALERVKHALALTDAQMAVALGMSGRSLSRVRKGGRHALGLVPSDRLYRLARIFALAKDVLEDEDAAREWLHARQVGLGDRVPLDLLNTEAGARDVEDLLGRIEFGVLS